MMKMLRMMVVFLVTAVFLCAPMTASAASYPSAEYPLYRYVLHEDGTAGLCMARSIYVYEQVDMWTLPATIDGYTVTTVQLSMSHIDTKALVLPETLKHLTPYSLDAEFDALYLPEGLETISYFATYYAGRRLKEVVIPTTVTSINDRAFGWHSIADPSGQGAVGYSEQTEGFTVYSDGNDVARDYAASEGYAYVDLSEYEKGDMDIDGANTMIDVLALYQMSSGQSFGSPVHHVMGDCNADGEINMRDLLALYNRVAGQ